MASTTVERTHESTLRFLAGPADLNVHGKVHGGAVMKWMDEAGYVCATAWCGRPCVTVYVGGIRFYRPILVGQLVEVRARLIHTGRTSMHIAVNVSGGEPAERRLTPTTHSVMVFVALDEAGVPLPAPVWKPRTAADRRLCGYAERLTRLGRQLEEEMRPHLGQPAGH
ncbi:MAG: acyl-CoA thioesterase [Lentisphaeria bacterium]